MRDIYEVLEKLNISFEEIEHEPVFTIEEAQRIESQMEGIGSKNLFLTDKKGHYFLVVLEENKRANIKELSKLTGATRLAFADSEELINVLHLEQGSVSPLGIINDHDNRVLMIIDRDLQNSKLLVHPNVNNKTISIWFSDLIKLIHAEGHDYLLV